MKVDVADGMERPILEMAGIHKRFPGVYALRDVNFTVARGEIHALVGENGAGKSTLMKILSGAYRADRGEIRIGGETIVKVSPQDMLTRGIAVIYQELMLAPHLSVAENIFLGRLPRSRLGTIDWTRACAETCALAERLGFRLDPQARLDRLSVAQRQMVEIAKALSRNARLIVLDEPSAVLGDAELGTLFEVIERLSRNGVAFIYISHRLSEVFRIAHRVTVLRDGVVVGTRPVASVTNDELIRMMVGRPLTEIYPERMRKRTQGTVALRVSGLQRRGVLHDIDLEVKQGEILGICGLAGAGRTELLRAIVGADVVDAGRIELFAKPAHIKSPRDAIALGVGLLPEDRKTQGLFLSQSVAFNVMISRLERLFGWSFLDLRRERSIVWDYIRRLRIKTPGTDAPARSLSGGTQQKCVLAKQLNARCRVLLVDEPTRGIDVGAKREIYQILTDLADRDGAAIIMVSSELPEILGLSDRMLVMRGGRIVARFNREDASEEAIMRYAA